MIKPQKISTNWSEVPHGVTYYFIGQPKTGKTTTASRWSEKGTEGVLLIDTDLGSDYVEGANVVTATSLNIPYRELKLDGKSVIKNGKTQMEIIPPEERGYYYRSGENRGKPMPVYSMVEIYQWLKQNFHKQSEFNTIVIDTIDVINKWIEEEVIKELGITGMGEGSWGADWFKARKRNVDLIKKLQLFIKKNGYDLVLISHSKSSTSTDGKIQLLPELPRGLAYALSAKADVIGYTTANKEDGKYYISFQSYDERAVGSRLKPLAQKTLLFDYDAIKNEILNYKEE
jgi:hypothetical protein|tara:strand:- start:3912 stop:4772 length:861 start_codon:yes stop_codon:yes gene_type:complete